MPRGDSWRITCCEAFEFSEEFPGSREKPATIRPALDPESAQHHARPAIAGSLLLLTGPLSRPPRLLCLADAPASFRTHSSPASPSLAIALNARILNGVVTSCGAPDAQCLELSLNRCEAIDFGLQAGEGIRSDVVLSSLSWHSKKAYQQPLLLKTFVLLHAFKTSGHVT